MMPLRILGVPLRPTSMQACADQSKLSYKSTWILPFLLLCNPPILVSCAQRIQCEQWMQVWQKKVVERRSGGDCRGGFVGADWLGDAC